MVVRAGPRGWFRPRLRSERVDSVGSNETAPSPTIRTPPWEVDRSASVAKDLFLKARRSFKIGRLDWMQTGAESVSFPRTGGILAPSQQY